MESLTLLVQLVYLFIPHVTIFSFDAMMEKLVAKGAIEKHPYISQTPKIFSFSYVIKHCTNLHVFLLATALLHEYLLKC